MMSAFAAFQGWDALYAFAYAHNRELEARQVSSYFDIKADTCRLAHMPACVALFVRRDVSTAKELNTVSVSPAAEREALYESMNPWTLNTDGFGMDGLRALQHAIGIQLKNDDQQLELPKSEEPQDHEYLSDTHQLRWNTTVPSAGYFLADTPRTKLFTGFVHGRSFQLSDVKLDIGTTKLDWATVSLVCLDGKSFTDSGRILITATGCQQNQGAQLEQRGEERVTLGRRWGHAPVQCEGIPATITLPPTNGSIELFPLDERGDRRKAIEVSVTSAGTELQLKPEHKTVWYELVIHNQ